ncbi:MAG: hypothetical protein ACLUIW_07915 [Dysosmobacter welbionis]
MKPSGFKAFLFASCKRFRRRKTPWRKGGGTKERHLLLADVSLSWQGVTIQILSGRSNSLAFKFAIFLEKHPTGLLAGGAFAPYKRFTTGKTLAQGEFTSPEHFNH